MSGWTWACLEGTRRRLGLGGLLLALTATSARAEDGFDLELFAPLPAQGRNILGVPTNALLGHGQLAVGLFAHYQDDPMTLRDDEDRDLVLQRLVDSRVATELSVALGLFSALELGVVMPLVLTQSGEDLAALGRPGDAVGGFALGDLRVIPRARLLGDGAGFGLQLLAPISLPTGAADQYAGDGGVRVSPGLVLDYATRTAPGAEGRDAFRIALALAYELRPKRQAGTYVSDDLMRVSLGARARLAADFGLLVTTQVTVQTADGVDPNDPTRALDDAPNVSFEALAALELVVADGLVLTAGGGTSIVHTVGSPDLRAFFGVGWTPMGAVVDTPDEDPDGDGILAAKDKCPNVAEDKDGFEDQDGCPDLDNDQDGIVDAKDKCPNEPENKNGVDDLDGCPDPEVVAVKDPDQDGDGIPDKLDKCPTQPEDKDGVEDQDGCPDLDNDKDGVPDTADKCPNEPEKQNGFEDQDGCPDADPVVVADPDQDGDGIPDRLDKCPDRPEVKNGVKDDDGCPDTAEKDIELTERELKILKKVNFSRDADKIAADSLALLDTVAKVLSEHRYLTKVRVEGHTDSEGPDDFNLQLSQRRADAVMGYLVSKGIDPQRLVAQGFGESKPIAKNDTPGGRAKNRRVEFKIMEVLGKPLPEPVPPPK